MKWTPTRLLNPLFLLILVMCSSGAPMGFCQTTSSALFLLPPLLARPTPASIALNLVAGEQDVTCFVRFRRRGESASWLKTGEGTLPGNSPGEMLVEPLAAGSTYQYQVHARPRGASEFRLVTEQTLRPQRLELDGFSFAILSDAHITPFHKDRSEVLSRVSAAIFAKKPDFLFMLGDNIQTFSSHGGPLAEERFGPALYSHLRHALGGLPSAVPVFGANGNWEGENGWHPERERGWAMKARRAFLSGPAANTYPEGGGESGDYYGFTWGSALFLVLNVTGYTGSDHTHGSQIGKTDDWTLGERQKEWLLGQLSRSTARWKLLFIHHTVGGNAGDDLNSRYGRGGGRAARVGEQALIHRWMREYGVQVLFYGHDHVFTDMTVDGIHYTCVGSAGAPWKFTEAETGYSRCWTPSGYAWVDVGRKSLRVSFVEPGAAGTGEKVLHSFPIPGG